MLRLISEYDCRFRFRTWRGLFASTIVHVVVLRLDLKKSEIVVVDSLLPKMKKLRIERIRRTQGFFSRVKHGDDIVAQTAGTFGRKGPAVKRNWKGKCLNLKRGSCGFYFFFFFY